MDQSEFVGQWEQKKPSEVQRRTGPIGTYSKHPPPAEPPIVTLQPFLPPDSECWDLADKFSHPKEMIPPKFEYPRFVFRSQFALGEATILVQIDEFGYPKRLSVVSCDSEIPARLGIEALKKARWWTEANRSGRYGVWFFYKAAYPAPPDLPDDAPEEPKK